MKFEQTVDWMRKSDCFIQIFTNFHTWLIMWRKIFPLLDNYGLYGSLAFENNWQRGKLDSNGQLACGKEPSLSWGTGSKHELVHSDERNPTAFYNISSTRTSSWRCNRTGRCRCNRTGCNHGCNRKTVLTDYVIYDSNSYSTKRNTKKCIHNLFDLSESKPQNIFLTLEAIVAKAIFKSNLNWKFLKTIITRAAESAKSLGARTSDVWIELQGQQAGVEVRTIAV